MCNIASNISWSSTSYDIQSLKRASDKCLKELATIKAKLTSSKHDDKHCDPVNVQRFLEIEATISYIDEKHVGEIVVQNDEELKILDEPEQISKEAIVIEYL